MAPDPQGPRSELLGPLPVINHFLDRIGLADSLQRFLPHDDARLRLAPAVVVGVVEIVLSFHSIGRHYRGVVGAVIVFFRKAELGEDGRQAYDVSVAGGRTLPGQLSGGRRHRPFSLLALAREGPGRGPGVLAPGRVGVDEPHHGARRSGQRYHADTM